MYTVHYSDPELERMHHAKPPFSFPSAVKYVAILSVLLWWLPTFGQMIAGYVGGRRAGSPWKGVLAALVPVAIIYLLVFAAQQGFFGSAAAVGTIPGNIASAAVAIPVVGEYVAFVMEYLTNFFEALTTTAAYGLNGFLVTLVFAYIGGIFAEQARRELPRKSAAGAGMSVAHPILSRLPAPRRRPDGLSGWRKVGARRAAAAAAEEPADEAPPEDEAEEEPDPEADEEIEEEEDPEHGGKEKGRARRERFVNRALRRYERGADSP
jgi:hypothetical protein